MYLGIAKYKAVRIRRKSTDFLIGYKLFPKCREILINGIY
jgi:hypothetical protein